MRMGGKGSGDMYRGFAVHARAGSWAHQSFTERSHCSSAAVSLFTADMGKGEKPCSYYIFKISCRIWHIRPSGQRYLGTCRW